jgi:dihydropteroate synthase
VIQYPSVVKRKKFKLCLPSGALMLGERTLVMGVLNVTPDSFFDGGLFLDADAAVARALEMERAGADMIDVGGESTRPGAKTVSASEEMRRILPVLEKLRGRLKIPISIDTSKAEVAEAAAYQGAEIINDVTALRADPRLAVIAAKRSLPLVLMHMRGDPRTMQKRPFARDVLRDVSTGLRRAVRIARRAGVPKTQVVLDPGIGFGKSAAQNYELLRKLPELARLGHALLVGTSRKSFLANVPGAAPDANRIWGTAATVAVSILGGAHIVRVHDVAEMAQVARVTDAVMRPQSVSAQAAKPK